jgi:hypothetical protein
LLELSRKRFGRGLSQPNVNVSPAGRGQRIEHNVACVHGLPPEFQKLLVPRLQPHLQIQHLGLPAHITPGLIGLMQLSFEACQDGGPLLSAQVRKFKLDGAGNVFRQILPGSGGVLSEQIKYPLRFLIFTHFSDLSLFSTETSSPQV